MEDIKELLIKYVDEHQDELIRTSSEMVRIPSEDPPSDTHAMVDYLINEIKDVEGITYQTYTKVEPKISLLVWLKGNGAGKKLVFNGHIDTFLVGSREGWDADPFSGLIKDGKIYGRGSCDMKAAIAGYLVVLKAMAEYRDRWSGEICFTFASDEESAGIQGTQAILDEIPEALGDAMIKGDVGSPKVLKFGEKGFLDMEIRAVGKAAHGLHKYKGINAIDRLMAVLQKIEAIEQTPVIMPEKVLKTILAGKEISESIDMPGEVENMQHITVNVGKIEGGYIYSTIPANAAAQITIGIPIGMTLTEVKDKVISIIQESEGISYHVFSETEPSWTDPEETIFGIMHQNTEAVLGEKAVISLRSGFDDSRFYRYKGIPAVLLGVTEHAMGDANEYFEIQDMINVTKIYLATAYDFLTGGKQ
ncbi:MAG: M20/M25/M40 family metallo-hydrolase [Lachnospiraceae bacterium]|nr:M20/M25/M40 family metallo-hydrolase [Lachnospiraceae bacterium]